MGRGGRIAIGVVMALIGVFFLVAGYVGDDMWFPVRHHGALPPGTTPGMHHWEADPVGYLLAAMMWVLVIAVGVILFAQGVRGRTTPR
jgi:hypothetical protein